MAVVGGPLGAAWNGRCPFPCSVGMGVWHLAFPMRDTPPRCAPSRTQGKPPLRVGTILVGKVLAGRLLDERMLRRGKMKRGDGLAGREKRVQRPATLWDSARWPARKACRVRYSACRACPGLRVRILDLTPAALQVGEGREETGCGDPSAICFVRVLCCCRSARAGTPMRRESLCALGCVMRFQRSRPTRAALHAPTSAPIIPEGMVRRKTPHPFSLRILLL